jgi:hypothetical protein
VYLVMIVPEAVHGTGMEVPEWFHEDTRQMPHGECIDGESHPGCADGARGEELPPAAPVSRVLHGYPLPGEKTSSSRI